jgi:hypothetical protein
MIVCDDPQHHYLCFQPCPGCALDCDAKFMRPATEAEIMLYKELENDPDAIGITNPRYGNSDL